jgi:hypothetical protein
MQEGKSLLSVQANQESSWPQWHTYPTLSRVAFTLGNLTTSNGYNRTFIGMECKSLKYVLGLVSELSSRIEAAGADSAHAGVSLELVDVTVKILRLLANLCIDNVIGAVLAKRGHSLTH